MSDPTSQFPTDAVQQAFDLSDRQRGRDMLHLRQMIYDTAMDLNIGPISETLKWGQPSYVPTTPKTGTAVRIGAPKTGGVGLYVHCQTDIIGPLAAAFPATVTIDGNRGLLFHHGIDDSAATALITAAFTYYL